MILTSLFTALVILSILRKKSLLSKVLSIPVIDWLGKLSYSIYLWHYPIIILISGGKKSSVSTMLIEIILTLVMAVISYYLVETPIRRGILSKTIHALKTKTADNALLIKKGISIMTLCLTLIITSCLCVAFVPKQSVMDQKEETITVSDEEILNNLNLLLIGDSVAEGASAQLHEAFPLGNINAEVSRHCSDAVIVLKGGLDTGWDGDCLVFSLGTNGPMYDYMQKIRDMLKPDKHMFILSIRAPYEEWADDNNEKIKQFCEEHDNVYFIDWVKYSEGHPDWFISDETHLTASGTKGFADCIKEGVLNVYRKNK